MPQTTEGFVLRSGLRGRSNVFLTRYGDAEGWGALSDARVFANQEDAEAVRRGLWRSSEIDVLRFKDGKAEEIA